MGLLLEAYLAGLAGTQRTEKRAGRLSALALGAGIPLATLGGVLLAKPEIRAELRDAIKNPTSLQAKDQRTALPPEAVAQAQAVRRILEERGLDPATMRMAVDAPPGTGKTTLSRALAQEMGLSHYGLDWLPHNTRNQILGGGHIEKMPRAPRAGEILEHFNLLRAYDPEVFDAAIHIKRNPDRVKQQLLERGRSAAAASLLDYDKSMAVGDLAFDTLAGEPQDVGGGVHLKLRPREGWGAETALDLPLRERGIDPSKLTRHEKLLSMHAGKKTTGSGWVPYTQNPFSGKEMAVLGAGGVLGLGAALAAAR